MNMTYIVVAYGKNREIGAAGDLPWGRDLPDDLKHFQKLTRAKSIIMGRKTFESIGAKPLPDRQNIVVASRPTGVDKVLSALTLSAALALAQYEPVIIGGERIFAEALVGGVVDTIYATEVAAEFTEADVFFPALNAATWHETTREHHEADERNAYAYDFVTYERR